MKSGTVQNPFLYDADDAALQRFFLLGAFVAGKHAGVMQQKLDAFLAGLNGFVQDGKKREPFQIIHALWASSGMPDKDGIPTQGRTSSAAAPLPALLREVRTGQYARLARLLNEIAWRVHVRQMKLRTMTRQEICELPGIGMKTASMFCMFTRRGTRMACLDTHILKYMKQHKLLPGVPDATPSSSVLYLKLEQAWLDHCDELQQDPAAYDFEIWKAHSTTMKPGSKFLAQM
jgi:hypothetical protein